MVPNAVDLDLWPPGPGGDTAVWTGRIVPEKGLHVLVEAFHLLAEQAPGQVRLRVAGYLGARDRKYLEDLEARIAGWGLSGSYERVGEVDRAEKIRFLKTLDVLSVPTTYREPKGLFVLEASSVIIQVFWFKRTGRRIFRMAPIHHHFEQLGWKESTVVIRFWIIAIVLAVIGLATLKLR